MRLAGRYGLNRLLLMREKQILLFFVVLYKGFFLKKAKVQLLASHVKQEKLSKISAQSVDSLCSLWERTHYSLLEGILLLIRSGEVIMLVM